MRSFALVLGLAAFAQSALACEPSINIDENGNRIESATIRGDCSFEYAGQWNDASALSVVDLGGGKTFQIVTSREMCPMREHVVFYDCSTGQYAVINGVMDPRAARFYIAEGEVDMGAEDLQVEFVLAPVGPLELTEFSDLELLLEEGADYGLLFSEKLVSEMANADPDDRVDLSCGCKLFYPSLAGSKK
ncbi:MAG: hypothetical protein AAFQ39_10555 [Pseudomonadota bacterium]